MLRNALAKLTLSAPSTSHWATPSMAYSMGSSMVMTLSLRSASNILMEAYKVVVLPLPVGPVRIIIPWLRRRKFSMVFRCTGSSPRRSKVNEAVCKASSRKVMRSPCLVGKLATRTSTERPLPGN